MENLVVGKEYFKVEHDVIYRIKVSGKTKKGNYKYHKTKPFEGGGILVATDQVLAKLDKAQMQELLEREAKERSTIEYNKKRQEVHSERLEQIGAFFRENEDTIRELCFEKARKLKPYVKNECIDDIASYCDGTTPIMEWYDDGCDYDRSGSTRYTGKFLTLENTVDEVLGNHTGRTTATYMSGCGLWHSTINDNFAEDYEDRVRCLVEGIIVQYIIDNLDIKYDEYFFKSDVSGVTDICDWEIWDIICCIRCDIGYSDAESLLDGIDLENTTVQELLQLKEDLPENDDWDF